MSPTAVLRMDGTHARTFVIRRWHVRWGYLACLARLCSFSFLFVLLVLVLGDGWLVVGWRRGRRRKVVCVVKRR